jgi:ABC-type bacteriocin/lantibiotic exporter with double-glycine peptidase domain
MLKAITQPHKLGSLFLMCSIACSTGLLNGCASLQGYLDGTADLSSSAVVLDVPYEQQSSEYLCGLAAADMVSHYYNSALDAAERQHLLEDAQRDGGITGGDLKTAFEKTGFIALVFRGTLDSQVTGIFHHLDKGRPLIVMYAGQAGAAGHYVVVTGYDPQRDTLVVLDPDSKRRVVTRESFARLWEPSGYFTLLASPQPRHLSNGD